MKVQNDANFVQVSGHLGVKQNKKGKQKKGQQPTDTTNRQRQHVLSNTFTTAKKNDSNSTYFVHKKVGTVR